jgi:hypothetical protein
MRNYDDCIRFISHFDNTCDTTAVVGALTDVPIETMNCENTGRCPSTMQKIVDRDI